MGDRSARHKLNGVVVNSAEDLESDRGAICLQSETAEVFYRRIEIKEFDQIIPVSEFLGQTATPRRLSGAADNSGRLFGRWLGVRTGVAQVADVVGIGTEKQRGLGANGTAIAFQ